MHIVSVYHSSYNYYMLYYTIYLVNIFMYIIINIFVNIIYLSNIIINCDDFLHKYIYIYINIQSLN